MSYSPERGGHEPFTNIFVSRWTYNEFTKCGKWPEQTIFVIDERDYAGRSSINHRGHYQADLAADSQTASKMMPKGKCWYCHDAHAAPEHTLLQFYPTVKVLAKQFGIYHSSRERVADAN